jgi:hypothetical protein
VLQHPPILDQQPAPNRVRGRMFSRDAAV